MNILIIDDERTFKVVERSLTHFDNLLYARDYQTASDVLLIEPTYHHRVVYLDHDLGENQPPVSHLTKLIEELAYSGTLLNVDEFIIHSANPVGRAEMYAALSKFYNVRFARAEDLM